KVTLILAAALAIAATLSRQSASLRHWVLSVGIACAVAVPFLISIAPSWHTPPLMRPQPVQPVASVAHVVDASDRQSAGAPAASGTGAAVSDAARFDPVQWAIAIWVVGTTAGTAFLLAGLLRLSWIRSRAQHMPEGMWRTTAQEVAGALGIRRRITLLH